MVSLFYELLINSKIRVIQSIVICRQIFRLMTLNKLLQQSLLWRGFCFITLLVVNVLLSRFLHSDGGGRIYYLTNFFSMILLLASLSMESGYTFYASSLKIDQHKLAWFSILWTAFVGMIVALLVNTYFYKLSGTNSFTKEEYLHYSLEYICGILLMNYFSVLFFAQKNYFLPNLLIGIINILLTILVIVASKTALSPSIVIHSYFISVLLDGVVIAVAFIWINKSYRTISLPTSAEFKILLCYSILALAGNFIFFLVYRIDFWFVEHYRTQTELGNYIQASKLGQMLLIIPQILASVVFPQTAQGLNEMRIKQNILIISRLLMQFFLVLIVLAYLFGKTVFVSVFGITFYSMHLPFLLLLPGILALAILTLFSAYFGGSNRVKVNVAGASIALVFMVAGNYFFTFKYGMVAAAIISSISYAINLFFSLYVFFKTDISFSLLDFFRWKKADYLWVKQLVVKGL